MAVDTASDRRAMLNFGFDDVALFAAPSGTTVDATDRAQLLGLYNGFTLGDGTTTPPSDADPGVPQWARRRSTYVERRRFLT